MKKIGSIKILDNTNFEGILEVGENYNVEDDRICVTMMTVKEDDIEDIPIKLSRIEKYIVLSYKEV